MCLTQRSLSYLQTRTRFSTLRQVLNTFALSISTSQLHIGGGGGLGLGGLGGGGGGSGGGGGGGKGLRITNLFTTTATDGSEMTSTCRLATTSGSDVKDGTCCKR